MQIEYIGPSSIDILPSIVKEFSASRIFLVTGKSSYDISGAAEKIQHHLRDCYISRFSDFDTNPKIEDLHRGIQLFIQSKCDIVVAIGGGSVIDMAKLINCFATNNVDPQTYLLESKISLDSGKPLIALPTTSGSGSEATHFAVLYIDQAKYSVADATILPDITIVDPNLTTSLPAKTTAATGMDAFCQAMESYWSVNSTDQSKQYAQRSIQLTLTHLSNAVNAPTDSARVGMAEAAHLAGKAINITKTTAPHAISYALTSLFRIPHGHAVALTLSPMLEYILNVTTKDISDPRGIDYVRENINQICGFLGASSVNRAQKRIDEIMDDIGLERTFRQLNIDPERAIKTIMDAGFNLVRAKNNPRKLTKNALKLILQKIR